MKASLREKLDRVLQTKEMGTFQFELYKNYDVAQNKDKCPCGSTKMYKHCCKKDWERAKTLVKQKQDNLRKTIEQALEEEKNTERKKVNFLFTVGAVMDGEDVEGYVALDKDSKPIHPSQVMHYVRDMKETFEHLLLVEHVTHTVMSQLGQGGKKVEQKTTEETEKDAK